MEHGLGRIAEFGFNFDSGEHDNFGSGNREVYEIPQDLVEEARLEGDWLIKFHNPDSETGVSQHQNKQETMAYLESMARGQDFVAPVICGSTDYSWIVMRKLHEVEEMGDPDPARQRNPVMFNGYSQESGSPDVVPDNWFDDDHKTEYGFDGKQMKVLDAGMLEPRDGWSLKEPLEEPCTKTSDVSGDEYFYVSSELDSFMDISVELESSSGSRSLS